MTLKHIMLELSQWFEMKMKNAGSRRKFVLCICLVILLLVAATAANGVIMQKQFGSASDFGKDARKTEGSSHPGWDTNGKDRDWHRDSWKGWDYGSSGSPAEKKSGSDGSESFDGSMMQPTPFTSAIIIAGVLAAAVITAMAMYLQYRRKHIDQIAPLSVIAGRDGQ